MQKKKFPDTVCNENVNLLWLMGPQSARNLSRDVTL